MRSFATCVASLVITATAFDSVSDDGGEAALAVGSGVSAGWPTAWWKESWSSTCSGEPFAERIHKQCDGEGSRFKSVTCNQTHAIQREFEDETCSTTGAVRWERNLCEGGDFGSSMIECDAPSPPWIYKVDVFQTAGCTGVAIRTHYGGISFDCNLPTDGDHTTRWGWELEGNNVTSKEYLANDTTCSGESSSSRMVIANECIVIEEDGKTEYQWAVLYETPTCSSTNHDCASNSKVNRSDFENAQCGAVDCTDSECCQSTVKDSGTRQKLISAWAALAVLTCAQLI